MLRFTGSSFLTYQIKFDYTIIDRKRIKLWKHFFISSYVSEFKIIDRLSIKRRRKSYVCLSPSLVSVTTNLCRMWLTEHRGHYCSRWYCSRGLEVPRHKDKCVVKRSGTYLGDVVDQRCSSSCRRITEPAGFQPSHAAIYASPSPLLSNAATLLTSRHVVRSRHSKETSRCTLYYCFRSSSSGPTHRNYGLVWGPQSATVESRLLNNIT